MLLLLIFGSFCSAFLLAWCLNWFSLIPWRRSLGKHWTERARLLYPARKSARFNTWLISVNLGVSSFLLSPEINSFLVAISGFCGASFAGYFFDRELFPPLPFKLWLRPVIAGLFIFFLSWVILIFTAFKMPANFSVMTWLVAGGILILLLSFSFGFGLRLMRWFRVLQPASGPLQALVNEVSQKMNVPVRATWILSTFLSNAVAFPLTRELIFTDKLLSTSSGEEIKAVCAHELGHLSESRNVLFVRSLFSFAFFPIIFIQPLNSLGENGATIFTLLWIGSLLIFLLGIRVARRMEKRADKIAAEQQSNEAVYASALLKLYEVNQMPAVMPRRSSKIHPDLYDRMTTAGVTPDFPKPLPPRGMNWTTYLMLAGFLASPVIIGIFKGVFAALNATTIHIR